MTQLFDRSLLPPARFEFIVIADTHYMLDTKDRPVEFESRRKQSARAAVALRQVAALEPAFVVHMGDLVQEYPETPAFIQALDEAEQQLQDCGVEVRRVVGNQDVGDKPDPTMPARPVTQATLEGYHQRFGLSWYSFDYQGVHCVVLNSQIMNTDMPEAAQQQAWLERDLAAHAGARMYVFWHLPPYLSHPTEPFLGNYDNIGQPARAWFLEKLEAYKVELLFTGHVHFAFCDNPGPTRYRVTPSTAFTRPGFSHLFAGPPPPEQGRDDTPKLGFYLCRVFDDRTDLHFIRTNGAVEPEQGPPRLITPVPPTAATTPAGLTLLHPLSAQTEVPIAWPSVVRQPVRNDYPLLSCLELGVAQVRVPCTDIETAFQRERLAILRHEGVRVQAFALWSEALPLAQMVETYGEQVDTWELQVAGTLSPPPACVEQLRACDRRVSLTPIVTERMPGKQHPRTRIGYRPSELAPLNTALAASDLKMEAALCRLDQEASAWDAALALQAQEQRSQLERVDLLFQLSGRDDAENALQVAEALFAVVMLPDSRLYLEPLVDFDRTMDSRHGLLDTLCNPRPAFQVLRCLNAALEPFRSGTFAASSQDMPGLRVLRLKSAAAQLALLLPEDAGALPDDLLDQHQNGVSLYHLVQGRVERFDDDQWKTRQIEGPVLLCGA